MANMITGIISISISAVILASVFMATIKGTNTTTCVNLSSGCTAENWNAAEIAMWGLLSLIGIVGLLYGVLNVFGLA